MGDVIVTVAPCPVSWTAANGQPVYCSLPVNHQSAGNTQACPVHRTTIGQESK